MSLAFEESLSDLGAYPAIMDEAQNTLRITSDMPAEDFRNALFVGGSTFALVEGYPLLTRAADLIQKMETELRVLSSAPAAAYVTVDGAGPALTVYANQLKVLKQKTIDLRVSARTGADLAEFSKFLSSVTKDFAYLSNILKREKNDASGLTEESIFGYWPYLVGVLFVVGVGYFSFRKRG